MFNYIKKILLITALTSTILYSDTILVPKKPGIYNITNHSARISFMDNSDNEDGFKIYNNNIELLMNKSTSSKEGVGYQYQNLRNLKSCTHYQLSIVAYNEMLQSTQSEVGSFRTLCDKKMNPPNYLGVYNIKENTARISFYDYSIDEDGFYLYNHGKLFKTISTTNKSGKGWQYINLSELNSSTYYSLTIEAFDNNGNRSGVPIGQSNGNFKTKSTLSKVQIKGNLTNATIDIYKIEDNGTRQLLYSEMTDNRGVFDAHRTELEDNRFYIYEANGGVDSQNSVDNKGTVRAVVKGSWLKNLNQEFIVSLVSEMSFIFIDKDLKYHFNSLELAQTLDEVSNAILVKDITGDNTITAKDLLVFEYQKDSMSMNRLRYTSTEIERIISDLYRNQIYRNSIFTPIISRNTIHLFNTPYEEEGVLTNELIGTYISSSIIKEALLENKFIVNSTELLSADKKRLFKLMNNYLIVFNIEDSNNPIETSRYRLASSYGKGKGVTLSTDEKQAFIVLDDRLSDYWSTDRDVLSLIVLDINTRDINFPKISDYNGYFVGQNIIQNTQVTYDNIKISISSDNRFELIIQDITDLTNPITIATYLSLSGDYINDMILSKDKTKLILAVGNYIEVVNISDIYNPTPFDSYNTNENIEDITVSNDNRIFVANYYRGFTVVDMSDPSNLIGQNISLASNIYYPDSHYIMSLYLSTDEKRLFLNDTDSLDFTRLIEIDISDSTHIAEVARYY